MPGKDCVDASGNFWARRFVGFSGRDADLLPRLPDAGRRLGRAGPAGAAEFRSADLGLSRLRRRRGAARRRREPRMAFRRRRLGGLRHLGQPEPPATTSPSTAPATSGRPAPAARRSATADRSLAALSGHQHEPVRPLQRGPAVDPAERRNLRLRQRRARGRRHDEFDGVRWTGWNGRRSTASAIPSRSPATTVRRSACGRRPAAWLLNPTYAGLHEWNGSSWSDLAGMSESRGLVEDSSGRLWSLGLAYELAYLDGANWIVGAERTALLATICGAIRPARGRSGRANDAEVVRTDGSYRYSRDYTQFPELDPQSDLFTTVAPAPDGIAWLGSTQGVFRLDANAGPTSTSPRSAGSRRSLGEPARRDPRRQALAERRRSFRRRTARPDVVRRRCRPVSIRPRSTAGRSGVDCRTPRSRLSKCAIVPGGYELWMSCMSRGIAVLFVPMALFADGFESGGTAAWSVVLPEEPGSGRQAVEAENRVPDQRMAADRLAAPDRVDREEQDVPLAERRVDDRGALGELAAVVEQARDQQLVGVAEAHQRARQESLGDDVGIAPQLLARERQRSPSARPSAPRAPAGSSGPAARRSRPARRARSAARRSSSAKPPRARRESSKLIPSAL